MDESDVKSPKIVHSHKLVRRWRTCMLLATLAERAIRHWQCREIRHWQFVARIPFNQCAHVFFWKNAGIQSTEALHHLLVVTHTDEASCDRLDGSDSCTEYLQKASV
jgi:hypothetical protein